jgi:hypothetical protein
LNVVESSAYEDLGYTRPEPTAPPARPSLPATIDEDSTPTPDQFYLAEALSVVAPKGRITEVMLVDLNRKYGVATVTDALRMARGFGVNIHSAYGYVDKLCKDGGK